MRRLLGSLLPAVLLVAVTATACGDDDSGKAVDPSSTSAPPTDDPSDGPSDAPTKGSPGDPVDFELVTTLTETGAGGQISEVAVPLAAGDDVQAFVAQFETDAMKTRVQDAVESADVPEGMALYGAVVAIGCDAPTDVSVVAGPSGPVVAAQKVPSPMPECFAPMTTAALVLVPASAV